MNRSDVVNVESDPWLHWAATGHVAICDACEVNEAMFCVIYTDGWHLRCDACDDIDREANGY
jgi:hypothetical protein